MSAPCATESVAGTLLAADEPAPWELLNSEGRSPILILCDHASNRIPRALHQLGLDKDRLEDHIAYDIGCRQVSSTLSELFDATLLMACYSRLVIDLNRHPGDGSSIPEISDDILIPGNQSLTPEAIILRENTLFWPYHRQVEKCLERISSRGQAPIILAIHSFTPLYRGYRRPWHIGVLWDRDHRLSHPLLAQLRTEPGLCVGGNQPYHARNPVGYTMDVHGEQHGNLHVLLEIRQDLIADAVAGKKWAGLIHRHLRRTLADTGLGD